MKRILFWAMAALSAQAMAETAAPQTLSPSQIPAASFARLPLVSDGAISPDGQYFAFFSHENGRRTLISKNLATGKSLLFPHAEELDYSWFHWASDHRIVFAFAFTSQRQQVTTDETRLFAIDRDGKNLQHIIKPGTTSKSGSRLQRIALPTPQIQDKVIDWMPEDPDHIRVALDEDQNGTYEVRRVDIQDGEYEIEQPGQRGIQNWGVDRQGVLRLGWGVDITGFKLLVRHPEGNWINSERTEWGQQDYSPVGFDEDPHYLFVLGKGKGKLDELKKIDLATGEIVSTLFSHPKVDIEGIVNDPITGQLIGVAYTEHERRVHYLDKSFRLLQASADAVLPKTVNEITSMSRDRSKLVIFASSDTDPGVYYLWDRTNKKMDMLAEAMPGLPPKLLSPMRPVTYAARDNVQIPGYLTLPLQVEAKNLPTIIMPHGGPHARTERGYWFLRHFLASRGYAVLEPNFRGSSGYGDEFQSAGEKEWGGKMQDDLSDGVKWIVDQGIADPTAVMPPPWARSRHPSSIVARLASTACSICQRS
jgi:dipeptidyl aminopeptidase/acylaminoacyl peptidase